MTWPGISYVAEDEKGRIVGYVLAKMCVRLNIISSVTFLIMVSNHAATVKSRTPMMRNQWLTDM